MKLIILDRNGVINGYSDGPVKSPEEWTPLPGSLEAVARLTNAGYHVVVVDHPPESGDGRLDIETLNRIHAKMHRLSVEAGGLIEAAFFFTDAAECPDAPCAGLLEEIGRRLKIGLHGVPVISDNLPEIEAAEAVAARPILVRTGKGEYALVERPHLKERVEVFNDLATVADYLLIQSD